MAERGSLASSSSRKKLLLGKGTVEDQWMNMASQYGKETPSVYAILKFKESILSEIRTFEEERATVLKIN